MKFNRRTSKAASVARQIPRLVKRIVNKFHPELVILFGSHARGEADVDSDVDLLVVMPVSGSLLDQSVVVSQALPDLPFAVDISVTRPEDFAWRKEVVGTLEWPAVREGKVLYART